MWGESSTVVWARTLVAVSVGAAFRACDASRNKEPGTTDRFLGDARDAYGVVDVVPAQSTVRQAPRASQAPLSATPTLDVGV